MLTAIACADVQTDSQASTITSASRCPFGGKGSANPTLPDLSTTSAPAEDEGSVLGLSVSMPPKDYLAFKDEPYKIDLRLERTTLADIFEIDEQYEAEMARKRHILASRPSTMLLPGVPGVRWLTPHALYCKNWTKVFACKLPGLH